MKLTLSPTLTLPIEIFKYHWAALGITGSGKSYTIKWFVEQLLEAEQRVCIVDPKGDWWGLKSSADGKSAGFPIVIFGGEHADVPIDATSGAVVGELVATGNRPCIIDLKHFDEEAKCVFMIAFLGEIFRRNKGRLMLVLDEAHEFAPQKPSKDEYGLLRWTNRLLSQGRSLGIQVVLSSQRPAKVNKDSLTQTEVLFAMRAIHVHDREPIEAWVAGVGDTKKAKAVLESLARLQVGQGWLYAPVLEILEQIKFPRIKTFDSSATPNHAEFKMPKGWASVNLEELSSKMVKVKAEVDANDPKKLRDQIADLTRKLRDQQATPVRIDAGELGAAQTEIATLRRELELEKLAFGRFVGDVSGLSLQIHDLNDKLANAAHEQNNAAASRASESSREAPEPARKAPVRPPLPHPAAARSSGGSHRAPAGGGNNDELSGPERRVLNAIRFFEQCGEPRPRRAAAAAIAKYSFTSTGFTNPLGSLRSKGLIAYPNPDSVELTNAGRDLAGDVQGPTTLREFHSQLLHFLSGPEGRVLEPLIRAYPKPMSRDNSAAAANYSPTSTGYTNPLGSLRSRGFIDYPDSSSVVALDVLFPKSLR
ncbi:MAG: helicase HerA domain-containing protein [Phycisphaerales bacterium]